MRRRPELPPESGGTAAEAPRAAKSGALREDPSNPNGIPWVGGVVWRTERLPRDIGQAPETVIRGDMEIPEQKLSVRLSLHRNDDKDLPASHMVDIQFNLPPDFARGGVANIPGIMGETNRGIALAGVAVKVMDNFFMVGLSSAEVEMQRNLQISRTHSGWIS
jgi:hypothetical protein